MKSLLLCLSLLAFTPAIAGDKVQCKGTTQAGNQCKRKVSPPAQYCTQHDPSVPSCGAKTAKGTPCKFKVKKGHTKCHLHEEIAAGNVFNTML